MGRLDAWLDRISLALTLIAVLCLAGCAGFHGFLKAWGEQTKALPDGQGGYVVIQEGK